MGRSRVSSRINIGVIDLLIEAGKEPDAIRKQNILRTAEIIATESQTDAIKELTATVRELINQRATTLRRAA